MKFTDNDFSRFVKQIVESQELPRSKTLKILYRILNTLFGEDALYSEDNPYEEMLEMLDDIEKQ